MFRRTTLSERLGHVADAEVKVRELKGQLRDLQVELEDAEAQLRRVEVAAASTTREWLERCDTILAEHKPDG